MPPSVSKYWSIDGDAKFDAVEVLIGEFDVGQHAFQQLRLRRRLPLAAVGEALAAREVSASSSSSCQAPRRSACRRSRRRRPRRC